MKIKWIKNILGCIITLLLSSCSPNKLHIPKDTIVYSVDSLNSTEILFYEFIKVHNSNKLIFIFSDSSCSSCLFELQWWKLFIDKHKDLSPVFIINHPPEAFTPFEYFIRNSCISGYPAIKDKNFNIKYLNNFTNKDYCVITDSTMRIIYKGNPNKEDNFETEKYEK